jgi:hypothetical protein
VIDFMRFRKVVGPQTELGSVNEEPRISNQRLRRMSEGLPPPKRPEEDDETALMALRELDGPLKLATPGLERSARPLGRGSDGALKLRPDEEEGALKVRLGVGEGAERMDGRDRVRGEEMLGLAGGLLKIELPRKVEGRVTCEA